MGSFNTIAFTLKSPHSRARIEQALKNIQTDDNLVRVYTSSGPYLEFSNGTDDKTFYQALSAQASLPVVFLSTADGEVSCVAVFDQGEPIVSHCNYPQSEYIQDQNWTHQIQPDRLHSLFPQQFEAFQNSLSQPGSSMYHALSNLFSLKNAGTSTGFLKTSAEEGTEDYAVLRAAPIPEYQKQAAKAAEDQAKAEKGRLRHHEFQLRQQFEAAVESSDWPAAQNTASQLFEIYETTGKMAWLAATIVKLLKCYHYSGSSDPVEPYLQKLRQANAAVKNLPHYGPNYDALANYETALVHYYTHHIPEALSLIPETVPTTKTPGVGSDRHFLTEVLFLHTEKLLAEGNRPKALNVLATISQIGQPAQVQRAQKIKQRLTP